MPPGFSRRESAENISSSTFWMMIERPKVTSTGGQDAAAEQAVEHEPLEQRSRAPAMTRHDQRPGPAAG